MSERIGNSKNFETHQKGSWFRALERQHQKNMAVLHAAQRGEIALDGFSRKEIQGAITFARKELRFARQIAIYKGEIAPYPKVQQMKKGELWRNGYNHSNGNVHGQEDLTKYQKTTQIAAEEKVLEKSFR